MTTLRLAAAQLDFHPAFEGGGVRCLREPTGAWEGRGLSGLRLEQQPIDDRLKRLSVQIEEAYLDGFQPRLDAVVRFCRDLAVDLLVLPEYSVPLPLLPAVADAAGPAMTVVAGTHTVTFEGVKRSGVYERLGVQAADKPVIASAVAPVLRGGKIVALPCKLSASKLEPDLLTGTSWAPIPLGAVQVGVLVCLDFLRRRDSDVGPLVAAGVDACAVLAVPSLTPFRSLVNFERNAEEELFGYGRAVAYANRAKDGGTRIFTPEKDAPVPLAAGRPPMLAPGVEGVVVADVRLGEAVQRYRPTAASRPVAAAVLLDAGAWPELQAAAREVLAADEIGAALEWVERGGAVFRKAAEDKRLPDLVRERWRHLAEGAPGTQRVEHVHALVRDVWLPEGAARHAGVQKALVDGAVQVLLRMEREVERGNARKQELIATRDGLEEVLGRLEGVETAQGVKATVLDGVVLDKDGEDTAIAVSPPGEDGSFERWVRAPGPFPTKLRRSGLVGLDGDEFETLSMRSPLDRRGKPLNDPSGKNFSIEPKDGSGITLGSIPRVNMSRMAALLALTGHPPAWIAQDVRGNLFLVQPNGDMDPYEYDTTILTRKIRALAVQRSHMDSFVTFAESSEGRRFVDSQARLRGGKPNSARQQLNVDFAPQLCG